MPPSQHILATVLACLSLVLQHTSGRQFFIVGWHPFIVGRQRPTLGRQMTGSHHSRSAGHWCTPQQLFEWCCSTPVAGNVANDKPSWPAGHWWIPQGGFGKVKQKLHKNTLQIEPFKSNPEGVSRRQSRACILHCSRQSCGSLIHIPHMLS
ncbi:hypothetical protein CsSME_00000347 [Camellia sinensis var. sinensis]